VPFHITARVQGREALFAGIEDRVVRIIEETRYVSDSAIVAHAVMPNHLHLLVIKGSLPLHTLMQPLLRRVALLVQRHHGREGHVFERRYNHVACLDVDYVRNVIAYIHLNGARKGMCDDASDFPWSSHQEYRCIAAANPSLERTAAIARMVRLFGSVEVDDVATCAANYEAFIAWRLHCDHLLAQPDIGLLPAPPYTRAGDEYWNQAFHTACAVATARDRPGSPQLDVRDFMRLALQELAPDLPLSELRSGSRSRPLVRIRRVIIVRALMAGYSNRRIARFLNVSDTTVSNIKSLSRKQ
jgi:REP element-mobilizing transposase RayT